MQQKTSRPVQFELVEPARKPLLARLERRGEPARCASGATEAAMVLAELHRRNGRWKFRAVGQGFNDGLAPLARSFEIDVADEPAPPPGPAASPRYERIALVAADEAVTLAPAQGGFGEVAVTLTWSQGRRSRDGSGGAIDLGRGVRHHLDVGGDRVPAVRGVTRQHLGSEPRRGAAGREGRAGRQRVIEIEARDNVVGFAKAGDM